MRGHEAIWKFAELDATKYVKAYAAQISSLCRFELRRIDCDSLLGRGGTRLRNPWPSLSIDTRMKLMQETQDDSYPYDISAVLDERFQNEDTKRAYQKSAFFYPDPAGASSLSKTQRGTTVSVEGYQTVFPRLAHTLNHQFLVHLKIVYGRGSLAGVFDAALNSAENVVQLSRHTESATEAFGAVALRLSDVFATVRNVTGCDPDPGIDEPCMTISIYRMHQA